MTTPESHRTGGMTQDEWETVRRNHDAALAERDRLRLLLDRARRALPDDSPLHPEIRQALGLVPQQRSAA